MFEKILIANRGEIACRVMKTAKRLGIRTVAVFSDADADALHVKMADEAVPIGPPPAAESYIVIDKILDAIRQTGAQAVHPGYGFLSENPKFAHALDAEGINFIGPPATAIEAMGDKIESKKLADKAGVSTVPGYMGVIETPERAVEIADQIGYPVMIKASAGGGGKGMRIAWSRDEVAPGFEASMNEARSSFGDDRVFLEKFVTSPRHIEIQILADKQGHAIYLNERECSIQRRNQKVIEEAPSPFLDPDTRRAMGEQSVALAKAVDYCSAGTVEFIVDGDRNFYFLEMNTRLQVEHPVTELITGVDLVEEMIRVAAGEPLRMRQDEVPINGWAIESRLYAEDPYRGFLPSIGRLTRYRPPVEGQDDQGMIVRNDTGVTEGGEISMYYDPMIAKLCSWGPDRASAMERMRTALDEFEVEGIGHNLPFCAAVIDHPKFTSGQMTTAFIEEEYPDGFAGVEPDLAEKQFLAEVAVALHKICQQRETEISGTIANHKRQLPGSWVAILGDERFETSGDLVNTDWKPGQTLCRCSQPSATRVLKTDLLPGGYRLRTRGVDLVVKVLSKRASELYALMPVKVPPDTSKMLLCPMPGLVKRIDVAVGDEVQEGQVLVVVEAMKMQNNLRAEKKAKVKAVHAAEGASLAVDEVILEFE